MYSPLLLTLKILAFKLLLSLIVIMIHVMIIIIKMMTHIVILTLVLAIKHQRHNGLMIIVTDKPPARGLCAEVGATVSVTSAFASRDGLERLATVR